MKIYLFLQDKLINFLLPSVALGEFLFDENEDSESKLINISAKENNWYLMSTISTFVLINDQKVDSVMLKPNNFYKLERDKIQYLIYAIDTNTISSKLYSINNNSNFSISSNSSNIKLKLPFNNIGGVNFVYSENHYIIESSSDFLYLNNIRVKKDKLDFYYGDCIDLLNFKLIYLPNMFLIVCDPSLYNCLSYSRL